jgi:ankyrin repeat protein
MKHQTKESNKDQESTSSSTVKHPHIDSFGRTAIHIACQSDDFYESLSALMDHGFDPNIKDFNGFSPLHVAAQTNAIKAAKLLIKKKAEIDKPDSLGRNPLHFAVANNSLGVAEVLLENKANVNAKDSFGNSSLHIAVAKNLIEMVKLLLKYNVNPNATLHTGLDGRIGCVLHLAVVQRFCEMVEFLLNAGANPNQRNRLGETALHLTALLHPFHTTSLTIVDQLINKNANPNITDQFGRTPLYAATLNKNEDVVKMLLNCSTDIIDQSDKLEGMTPLHLAALHKSENMAVLLIEKGAYVYALDKNGLTPLDYAAASNATKVAKHLLDSTVDKAKFLNQAKYMRSPLHIAAAHDSVEVGDLLISNGANINSVDKLRLTPLHYATFRKKERFVKFLLDKQENTFEASPHQRGRPYQPKNRHQQSLKQQKKYLSKNLSPDELASVPQLINCEIPTIIQTNLRPPTVPESVNQLAFTVRGGAGLVAGPSLSLF